MTITHSHNRSMSPRRMHAVALLGSMTLVGVAVFQVSLSLGAPYGDAILGGHAATVDGVLTPPLRWAAAGQAALLLAMAWFLLGRGGLVRVPGLAQRGLRRAAWTIAAFMALNTLANVTSPHPPERWMVTATLLVALAGTTLAIFSCRTDKHFPTSHVDGTRVS